MRKNDTLRNCPDCGKLEFIPNGNMETRDTPDGFSNYEVVSSEWECSSCNAKYKEMADGRMITVGKK